MGVDWGWQLINNVVTGYYGTHVASPWLHSGLASASAAAAVQGAEDLALNGSARLPARVARPLSPPHTWLPGLHFSPGVRPSRVPRRLCFFGSLLSACRDLTPKTSYSPAWR